VAGGLPGVDVDNLFLAARLIVRSNANRLLAFLLAAVYPAAIGRFCDQISTEVFP
jgi:hypothetical protein